MALIICKECRRQFSDLAAACPGCAAPTAYSLDNPLTPAAAPVHTEQPRIGPATTPINTAIATPVENVIPGEQTAPAPHTAYPSAYQFVTDHTLPASHDKASPHPQRQVGVFLLLGIFLCPWIFYWLLLRSGHSALARLSGFLWLLLCSAILLFLMPHRSDKGSQVQQPVPEVLQPAPEQPTLESNGAPVFYPLPGSSSKNDIPSEPLATGTLNGNNTPADAMPEEAGMQDEQAATAHSEPASIYATQDDDETLHASLSGCLLQQAESGNFSAEDGGKSAARMISRCYADFKPWFDRCIANQQNSQACNRDAVDLAQATLKLSGH